MQRKTPSVHLNNYMDGDDKKEEGISKKKVKINSNNRQELNPVIAKVIKDAMLIHLARNEERQQQINELEAMYFTCQEFMKSFIILGYDLNGNPIAPIIHANNQQEADSLGSYLSKFVSHTITEINNQPDEN